MHPRGADSSISASILKIPVTPYGVTGIFYAQMGLERPLRKHAGGMFSGRGRVLQIQDAFGTNVDGF